jgi:hypothetical protein
MTPDPILFIAIPVALNTLTVHAASMQAPLPKQ